MKLYGLPVIESTTAIKLTGKFHTEKPWHKRLTYHQRIVKKWAKRFGEPEYQPCVIQTPLGFVIHPSLMNKLRNMSYTTVRSGNL